MKKSKLWLTVGIVLVFGFFKQDENEMDKFNHELTHFVG